MNRKSFPKSVEAKVLVTSRRRCAFCFGLRSNAAEKEGQIAHVDRDPSNVSLENAAWLCTKHHARYDSRSRQTKGHTPEELRLYQKLLYEYLASPQAWPDATGPARARRASGVSLDIYDRRVPFYKTTIQFIRTVLNEQDLELREILQFATDTDEVLFLFDDKIAVYLSELFKRALRLRAVREMLKPPDRRTSALVQERLDLDSWFLEQFEETRKRFVAFLRLP